MIDSLESINLVATISLAISYATTAFYACCEEHVLAITERGEKKRRERQRKR